MKKYSITTTVNGKALVKQEHTFGTDGCTTSYGDVWAFTNCAEAGKWVDSELGLSHAYRFASGQMKSVEKSVEKILAEEGVKLEPNPLSPASIMANILEARERILSGGGIKQDIGIALDKSQIESCVVSPEIQKSLLEKIAEDEKVTNE